MFRRSEEKSHHLENNQNDWDGLADHEMNFWQKVAKKTRGVVTAANALSITGTVMVINGLYDFANGQKGIGVAKIGLGRTLDIVDGNVAHATGTKGKVGKKLDPAVDMVQLGFALPLLEQHGALPIAAAAIVGVPKVVNTVGSVVGTLRGREVEVADEGKIGTFAMWIGIGSFALKAAIEKHVPGIVDTGLEMVGWAGTVGGTINQLPATGQYAQIGFGRSDQEVA